MVALETDLRKNVVLSVTRFQYTIFLIIIGKIIW